MSIDLQKLEDDEIMALLKIDLQKEDFDKALIKTKYIKKPDQEAISLIAKVYAQIGLFEKSRKYYEQFLKKDTGAVNERFQLGMVLHDSGDVQGAYQEWNNVLESEPTHPPTLFYKGLTLANEGKLAEAQQIITLLLQTAASDNLYFGRAKNLLDNMTRQETNPTPLLTGTENEYKSIN